MLLSLKDLRICYEKVEAVKGISIEVEEGAVVTLIGSNGAGKTTILRAISGLKKGHTQTASVDLEGKAPTSPIPDRGKEE